MVEQLARKFILESTTMEETSDRRLGYSVIHSYLREKSYPVTKDDKHDIRKHSQHFACEMKSYIYYIIKYNQSHYQVRSRRHLAR